MSYVRTWRYGPGGQAVLCETADMLAQFERMGYGDHPDRVGVQASGMMPAIESASTDAPATGDNVTVSAVISTIDSDAGSKPKRNRNKPRR